MSTTDPVEAVPSPSHRTTKQVQVRERLEELIVGLSPGEMLPAERSLATNLGVARMTLRRSVEQLVREGRLIRRQGAGTFVAPTKVDQRLSASSFSQDMRARGLRPGSRTVMAREHAAGLLFAPVLGCEETDRVLHVRRLRLADDQPMALEDLHVPLAVAPGLQGGDLEDVSFYELLATRYGTPVASGSQTVEPYVVDDEEADLLGCEPGQASFLFERTSRRDDGTIVEFVRSVYRGDRYRIVVDIFPDRG